MIIGQLQRQNHAKRTISLSRTLGIGFMGIISIYFLIPLVWLALATTKSGSELYYRPMFSLGSLSNFMQGLHFTLTVNQGIFGVWYRNSIIYSTVSATLSMFTSTLCGYSLAKHDFKFRKFFFALILISLLVPTATLALPTFLFIRDLGLINSYAGVILPMTVSPFGTYFMRVYLGQAIPDVLLDSARVDGAGEWRIFWRIGFPIARSGAATVFLIAFVTSWNNFFLPLLTLNNQRLFPLVLGLQSFPNQIMGSFLSICPTIILIIFLRNFASTGMLSGGIKM